MKENQTTGLSLFFRPFINQSLINQSILPLDQYEVVLFIIMIIPCVNNNVIITPPFRRCNLPVTTTRFLYC